ncbi:MAG: RNA polymerase sigma factor [Solirubrobacteraceae bacterium]
MTLIEETSSGGFGDVGELYGSLARRLEQIVRLDVRASDAVIEDACQFAWCRLLHHSHRVHRETVMAWLARTAVHEAFKLARRDRRELSLNVELEDGNEPEWAIAPATPEQLLERRERIDELRGLPPRQQRVVWLHAFGLSYTEIGAYEGCTRRTVDRQLMRARQAIRDGSRSG